MTGKVKSNGPKKFLRSVLVIGLLGGLAGLGAYSAFTATTDNTGNSIASGTVVVSDSDAGTGVLYSVSNMAGGQSSTPKCLRVTYSGSITADMVKFYISTGAVTNGTQFTLLVERGSGITTPGSNMNCTNFTSSSTAYSGELGSFPTSYASGTEGKAVAGADWATSDTVDYRFTITQVDDATANNHTSVTSSGAHTFTWEARS